MKDIEMTVGSKLLSTRAQSKARFLALGSLVAVILGAGGYLGYKYLFKRAEQEIVQPVSKLPAESHRKSEYIKVLPPLATPLASDRIGLFKALRTVTPPKGEKEVSLYDGAAKEKREIAKVAAGTEALVSYDLMDNPTTEDGYEIKLSVPHAQDGYLHVYLVKPTQQGQSVEIYAHGYMAEHYLSTEPSKRIEHHINKTIHNTTFIASDSTDQEKFAAALAAACLNESTTCPPLPSPAAPSEGKSKIVWKVIKNTRIWKDKPGTPGENKLGTLSAKTLLKKLGVEGRYFQMEVLEPADNLAIKGEKVYVWQADVEPVEQVTIIKKVEPAARKSPKRPPATPNAPAPSGAAPTTT